MSTQTTTRDEAWYDDFWDNLHDDEDDRVSAVRLIGEMFADGLLRRGGDELHGSGVADPMILTTVDQYLIRRIEDAAAAASSEEQP